MLYLNRNKICVVIQVTSVSILLLCSVILTNCSQEKQEAPAPKARPTRTVREVQKATVQIDPRQAFAIIETPKGTMEVEFYPDDAPQTVTNFVKNVRLGYYNHESFHTDNPGETIQAGSPLVAETFPLEKNQRRHVKGAIAMAGDGVAKSHASEFYICLTALEPIGEYAVFGKVTKGLDVLDKLAAGDNITKIAIHEKN